jgi:spectinomycin phosphotransferase
MVSGAERNHLPMLDKPDFPDEKIIACLQADFGLGIVQIAFLPLGNNMSTAVYRAVADDDTSYFCKLKRGVFDETSVALPKLLSEQGIAQIIPPLATNRGQLRAALDEFNLIVYPFVAGKNGFDVELTNDQWADFGAALKRIHTTILPPALTQNIEKETYDPYWREQCKQFMAHLDSETFDDPVLVDLAKFLRSKRDMVLDLLGHAEQLAHVMTARSLECVMCHTDIHPGNLFIDTTGALFIVDWDYPALAPKERDLMFIGGGQGFIGRTAQEEEQRFYQGYGQGQIDPIALAYYRYERNIMDIAVACEQILSSKQGGQDRAQTLGYLKWSFMPDCAIEIALKMSSGS